MDATCDAAVMYANVVDGDVGVVVELGSLLKTTGPGEDGSNGVSRRGFTLLVFPVHCQSDVVTHCEIIKSIYRNYL